MKHTPGPWEYDGKFTVGIPHQKGDTYFRTNPEDARLIAAAPELLSAVELAIDQFKDSECGCDGAPDGGGACYFHRIEDDLKRALKKAGVEP